MKHNKASLLEFNKKEYDDVWFRKMYTLEQMQHIFANTFTNFLTEKKKLQNNNKQVLPDAFNSVFGY